MRAIEDESNQTRGPPGFPKIDVQSLPSLHRITSESQHRSIERRFFLDELGNNLEGFGCDSFLGTISCIGPQRNLDSSQ